MREKFGVNYMLRVHEGNLDIGLILETLSRSGVVAFPTDTCYAFGVDATNDTAVAELFRIKSRPKRNAKSVAFADSHMLRKWVETDEVWEYLYRNYLPGPLTLILRRKRTLANGLNPDPRRIATRLINHSVPVEIIKAFERPITCTSANRHGLRPIYDPDLIWRFFHESVDILIDSGPLPHVKPSTILDLLTSPPGIIRFGPIDVKEILVTLCDSGFFSRRELASYVLNSASRMLSAIDAAATRTALP